jgi:hypothetical protein
MPGIIALSALTLTLCGNCAIENPAMPAPFGSAQIVMASEMQQDTVYKGRNLRLSATPNADGTWTGVAQFTDDPGRVVKTDAPSASQSEALSSALSHAMAAIDRDRMFRGKP